MRPINDNARIVELDNLEERALRDIVQTHPIYYEGAKHNLPVFKVDINFPLFRMENGRTKRKQLEFIHNFPERAHELEDPSSNAAQTIQLGILQEMASEANLLELLKQGQHEPLLLRHDGYVVNGNRRLAAMRLLHSEAERSKSNVDFSYVDVARLPILPEKEIRRIEQRLQMSQDGKADYNWVDELLTIQSNIDEHRMTIAELSKDMNKRRGTVANQQKMLQLINLFLERIGQPGQYFRVESDEQAFKTLATEYSRLNGDTKKQLQLLDYAFPIILENQPGESKHKRIGKITKYLPDISSKAHAEGLIEPVNVNAENPIDILDSISGGVSESVPTLSLTSESSGFVHEAIRELDRKKDIQDRANGPAEAVAEAATLLNNIQITSSMTKVKQFRGQLKAIRNMCDKLLLETESRDTSVD